jgi:pilus assembly protein CpaE
MANSETPISRRPLAISPNSPLLDQLEVLLKPHLGGGSIQRLQAYPSPRDLPNLLASGATHLVFLDTTGDRDQALQLLEEVGRLGGQVPVIAILGGNEPDFILRCLRAGASDFLILPLTPEQLDAAFGKLSRVQPAQEAAGGKEAAKTIAVMPAKGACGATTVACNLAFQWKRTSGKKVLLVDMDALTGNLSFLLKVKSVYSFLDALQRSNELDADLWGAMVRPVHGVDVLLAPELMLDQHQELRDPSPILDYARHAYDVVILDTSSVYTEWNLNIARVANELLLVTTNELPALQAAQRALSYLDTNRIGRWKIRLVVNRYLRDVGLSREVIGTALHTEVFETLPSDYDAVQKALLDGKPIPASTPFGKGMVEMVDRLGGKSQPPGKKGSSLSGLLGLFSKTSK